MTVSPRQMIAETLRDGRRWRRSYAQFKPLLDAMIRDGEVHQVAPVGGRARNMVELTGRGWMLYFGENLLVSRLDRFAELLAEGFEPAAAGRELGLTRGQAARTFADIKAQLGRQAA